MFIVINSVLWIALSCHNRDGPPPVSEKFTSKILNEFVMVKNSDTVNAGITIGIIICFNLWKAFAPSREADSTKLEGTFCNAAK